MLAFIPLFAEVPVDGWSTKELLIAIGSTLAVVIPIAWGIIEYMGRGYRSQMDELKNDLAKAQTGKPSHVEHEALRAEAASLKVALEKREKELAESEQRCSEALKSRDLEISKRKEVEAAAEAKIDQWQQDHAAKEQELGKLQNRINKAINRDSQTWNEKVRAGSLVKFTPLGIDTRTTPIISVLNLKGGVGKTTLTANLANAFDRNGFNTLMVDLDLQGSLTNMFLDPGEHRILDEHQKCLRHMLEAAFDSESPDIREYIRVVEGCHATLGLIPTSDDLAYSENDLALRWRLGDSAKDVRFLLRKQLQLKRVTDRYNLVLLDCPPFISVGCVNALAASDYLLIPVVPSTQATDRIPVLLNRLRDFRNNINPDLKVLGIVPNRTWRAASLTAEEESRMGALLDQCREIWGQPLYLFQTHIPQDSSVREKEDQRQTLQATDALFTTFERLAREIRQQLPSCFQASHAPALGVSQ
jgi:cellulose biosynthesis protein BcsQ